MHDLSEKASAQLSDAAETGGAERLCERHRLLHLLYGPVPGGRNQIAFVHACVNSGQGKMQLTDDLAGKSRLDSESPPGSCRQPCCCREYAALLRNTGRRPAPRPHHQQFRSRSGRAGLYLSQPRRAQLRSQSHPDSATASAHSLRRRKKPGSPRSPRSRQRELVSRRSTSASELPKFSAWHHAKFARPGRACLSLAADAAASSAGPKRRALPGNCASGTGGKPSCASRTPAKLT